MGTKEVKGYSSELRSSQECDRLRERVAELEEALEKLLAEASHSFKTGSPFDRPVLLANVRALLAKTK